MPIVTFTADDGTDREVDVPDGDSLMETAVRQGVPGIVGECGGALACATCHVFVVDADPADLPAMDEMEDEMLWGTAVDRRDESRLSCQLRPRRPMHVRTPETQQ